MFLAPENPGVEGTHHQMEEPPPAWPLLVQSRVPADAPWTCQLSQKKLLSPWDWGVLLRSTILPILMKHVGAQLRKQQLSPPCMCPLKGSQPPLETLPQTLAMSPGSARQLPPGTGEIRLSHQRSRSEITSSRLCGGKGEDGAASRASHACPTCAFEVHTRQPPTDTPTAAQSLCLLPRDP